MTESNVKSDLLLDSKETKEQQTYPMFWINFDQKTADMTFRSSKVS